MQEVAAKAGYCLHVSALSNLPVGLFFLQCHMVKIANLSPFLGWSRLGYSGSAFCLYCQPGWRKYLLLPGGCALND